MLLPQFLGIGAVKAGTTWLYENLREHPQIFMPARKPIYYFDRHLQKPIERYAELFANGADALRGEFTASYSVLPPSTIAKIHNWIPDVKLVLLLREPRARAWSEARMEFAVTRRQSLETVSEAQLLEFLESPQCTSRGDYPTIINTWLGAFPREQLFVDLYERIQDEPRELVDRVCAFLGVDPGFRTARLEERIFAGAPHAIPQSCRLLLEARYGPSFSTSVSQLVGLPCRDAWGY